MANSALTLRMLSREAFRLFRQSRRSRDSARAGEEFAVDPAIIGSQLRIRPPNDNTVAEAAQPLPAPADPAEGLFVRWAQERDLILDALRVRLDVRTEAFVPMPAEYRIAPENQAYFLRYHTAQYEDICRCARATPGHQFGCEILITRHEQERMRMPVGRENYAAGLVRQYDAEQERQRAEERQRQYVSERERAEKRSMELLYDWLSAEQRKELALEQYFTITGEFSGKRYQIHKVRSFGLKELDSEGNIVACFCVVPSGTHALGDTMLAQKVWMETDERSTIERANRMPQLGQNVCAGLAAQQMLGAQQAQGLGQLQATPEQLAQMQQAQAQHPALGLGYTPLGVS